MTPLTIQTLTILSTADRPLSLNIIFARQTETRHITRMGLLIRDLSDRNYIKAVNAPQAYDELFVLTGIGYDVLRRGK